MTKTQKRWQRQARRRLRRKLAWTVVLAVGVVIGAGGTFRYYSSSDVAVAQMLQGHPSRGGDDADRQPPPQLVGDQILPSLSARMGEMVDREDAEVRRRGQDGRHAGTQVSGATVAEDVQVGLPGDGEPDRDPPPPPPVGDLSFDLAE